MKYLKGVFWVVVMLISTAAVPLAATNYSNVSANFQQEPVQQTKLSLDSLETQRRIDSLKRDALQKEIVLLKSTDVSQRAALQEQIDLLKLQEATLLEEKKRQIERLRKSTRGHAVTGFFNDTLFLVHVKLGSFSPLERAEAINRRIRKLPENLNFHRDSLKVLANEASFDIVYQDNTIVTITENDALWEDTSAFNLATCLLYTSPSPRDRQKSRMPSSA